MEAGKRVAPRLDTSLVSEDQRRFFRFILNSSGLTATVNHKQITGGVV